MSRMVNCAKLGKLLPGLEYTPYPGEIGQKIYDTISQEAWAAWLEHQTMIINEYRLSLIDPKARKILELEMQKFLFEGGGEKPSGYVAPE